MKSLKPIVVHHHRGNYNNQVHQISSSDGVKEHKIRIGGDDDDDDDNSSSSDDDDDNDNRNSTSASDYVSIIPLGSGQEVGRSCILITYCGKSVMLDCGLHPALRGVEAMPYLDNVDLVSVDLLLVTHFHLDHAACLPYFLSSTSFNSRCFMTHPTKSIYKLIVADFIKVSTLSVDNILFNELDLISSMDKIETIDYHSSHNISGISFRAYHAGHVLGAAMFMIEISNVKILYTGDYSCDDDRHLKGAEIPSESPDILIIESTFGTQSLRPVRDREKEFTLLVHQIIRRGGRCLIPVFALGRAQELLLIMDEYWENNKNTLHHIPIYYASALAKKCLGVYATYINMMNPRIQQQYKVSNPFEFRHVINLRSREQFNDVGPSVVFASPGMLQNGLSRELFELWCTDRRNGLVIPGYAVEGTLAKIVQSEPSQVDGMRGNKLPLRMTVHYVMFAAHADHDQTKRFIQELQPPNVILVHGERKAMSRVKQSLNRSFGEYIRISDPANCQPVQIEFRKDKMCKVVGDLVDDITDTNINANTNTKSKNNSNISGLLIRKDFNYHIMAPKDLKHFTPLTNTIIKQSLLIPFNQSFTALSLFLSRIYDIKYNNKSKNKIISVNIIGDDANANANADADDNFEIIIEKIDKKSIRITWESCGVSDMIADSIIGLALTLDVDPSTAIAQQMMQPVNDINNTHQIHPSTSSNYLSNIMSSKDAFKWILSEHFDDINVECVEENVKLRDMLNININNNNNNSNSELAMVLNDNRNVIRYKFIVKSDDSIAYIAFKYNYKKLYNTVDNQKYFWKTKKEKLENNLNNLINKNNDKNNDNNDDENDIKKINKRNKKFAANQIKFRKKINQFQSMLDIIDDNKNIYFDQQFIPSFYVESTNKYLKKRIESILRCVDNALYPISFNFDCANDYDTNYNDNDGNDGDNDDGDDDDDDIDMKDDKKVDAKNDTKTDDKNDNDDIDIKQQISIVTNDDDDNDVDMVNQINENVGNNDNDNNDNDKVDNDDNDDDDEDDDLAVNIIGTTNTNTFNNDNDDNLNNNTNGNDDGNVVVDDDDDDDDNDDMIDID